MLVYVILAFALSYAFAIGIMVFLPSLGGTIVPHVAVLGPALAALVAVRREGLSPLRWLASQLGAVRPRWWWVLVPVAMVLATGRIVPGILGAAAGIFLVQALLIALPEEIGWRAYMTERLLGRVSPLVTGLLVGLTWGLWHGPKLLTLPGLLPAALAISLLLAFAYGRLGMRLWFAVLVHGSFNASIGLLERLPDPDAALLAFHQSALILLAAAIILFIAQRDWFLKKPYSNSTMTSST